jgi:hypothetical protein
MEVLFNYNDGNGVFCGSALRLYKEDPRPAGLYWELAADTHIIKLQRPQNKVLCTIENFSRCTRVRNLHTAFYLAYVYDYVLKLCRRQAEVIQNHRNEHVHGIGQGEASHRKYKKLKLDGGQAYDR